MITVEQIAEVCHEANRAYCLSLGDNSHKVWKDISWASKQSAIAAVVFLQENPNVSLKFRHEDWRKRNAADGWTYGDAVDLEEKTHPCMITYEKLPLKYQVSNTLFRAIVTALTHGEEPCPTPTI